MDQVCFLATGTIFILFFPLFERILFYASDKSLCCAFISDVADKKAVFENTNEQATKYVAEDNEETSISVAILAVLVNEENIYPIWEASQGIACLRA